MKRSINKALVFLMSMLFAFCTFVTTFSFSTNTASALSQGQTITYRFRTGDNAYAYGARISGATQQGTSSTPYWLQLFYNKTMDLSSAQYIAIQYKNNLAAPTPGFTLVVDNPTVRCNGMIDGQPFYFVGENGFVSEFAVQYDSFTVTHANCSGMILIPISALNVPTAQGFSWANVSAIGIQTNAYYNYGFDVTFGEIGFYNGDPANSGTTFTKYASLDSSADHAYAYCYWYSSTQNGTSVNGTKTMVAYTGTGGSSSTLPSSISYPFKTGDGAFSYGAKISGATQMGSTSAAYWLQLFSAKTVNMASATYIAFQFKNNTGNPPGFTPIIDNPTVRCNALNEGAIWYFVTETGAVTTCSVLYNAITVPTAFASTPGMILIPITTFNLPTTAGFSMANVSAIGLQTDAYYNYGFDIQIGEIGYYTGDPSSSSSGFSKYLSLNSASNFNFEYNFFNEANSSYGTCTNGTLAMVSGTGAVTPPDISEGEYTPTYTVKGLQVAYSFENATDANAWGWEANGPTPNLSFTTDTYGNRALKVWADKEGNDGYAAPKLFIGKFKPTEAKGFMIWVKNTCSNEVHFNYEIDVAYDSNSNPTDSTMARYNVVQGKRYYRYDINTGKESICRAFPTIVVPVGFEGWILIPSNMFTRPTWSSTAASNAPSKNDFLSFSNCYVYRIGISIDTKYDFNNSIAVNYVGTYKDVISLSTDTISSPNGIKAMYDNATYFQGL